MTACHRHVIVSSYFPKVKQMEIIAPCDVSYCNVINVNYVLLLDPASISNKLSISY